MDENELGNKGATAIIDAVKGNRNCKIINLARNELDAGITSVIGKLLQSNPEISGLSLAGNKVFDLCS